MGRGGAQLLGTGVADRREEREREREKEGEMDRRRQREKELGGWHGPFKRECSECAQKEL